MLQVYLLEESQHMSNNCKAYKTCDAAAAAAAGGSQMQGPSPLLPAWFEFALQPSRMQPSRGLQLGASPLQLPGHLSSLSQKEHHDVVSSSEGGSQLIGGVMPEKETLMRSEFLLPLDQDTTAMYHKLLSV